MMKQQTWIETRMADLEMWRERNAAIRAHAVEIYDALWRRMLEHLEEARSKGFPVETEGALQKRSVLLAKQNKPESYFAFDFLLVDSKTRIRASGDRVDFMLDLDLCDDGVVCLKAGAQQVSVDEAAILILDPFLFPQLQR